MNILEFVEDYKNNPEAIYRVTIKRYVSYLEKKHSINIIIENLLKEENGLLVYEPIDKHLMFILGFITLYTDLTYEDGQGFEAYDALMSAGIMDILINEVGMDYDDFSDFFEETLKEKIKFYNSFSNKISTFVGVLENIMGSLDEETLKTLAITKE